MNTATLFFTELLLFHLLDRIFKNSHTGSVMYYEPGTYIDLSHVNARDTAGTMHQKKSTSDPASEGYPIGTQFIFQLAPDGFKAALKIPVAFT